MNEAGVVLDELMRERGVDGIPELVRRMKEFPEGRTRNPGVVKVTDFMEEENVAVPPHFFRRLQGALELSDGELRRLVWLHFMREEPPADLPSLRRGPRT